MLATAAVIAVISSTRKGDFDHLGPYEPGVRRRHPAGRCPTSIEAIEGEAASPAPLRSRPRRELRSARAADRVIAEGAATTRVTSAPAGWGVGGVREGGRARGGRCGGAGPWSRPAACAGRPWCGPGAGSTAPGAGWAGVRAPRASAGRRARPCPTRWTGAPGRPRAAAASVSAADGPGGGGCVGRWRPGSHRRARRVRRLERRTRTTVSTPRNKTNRTPRPTTTRPVIMPARLMSSVTSPPASRPAARGPELLLDLGVARLFGLAVDRDPERVEPPREAVPDHLDGLVLGLGRGGPGGGVRLDDHHRRRPGLHGGADVAEALLLQLAGGGSRRR